MDLVWPGEAHLASYVDALSRGWSADTRRPEAAREELEQIEADPALFLAQKVDREASGPPITLPDGTTTSRLPGYTLWMWDGDFCGAINFRWQPGTPELPPSCPGHIGYSVVPWKRGRGYATRALGLILPFVRDEGLPYVELVTQATNIASQRVIAHHGGELLERFSDPQTHGGAESLRFRISLL